MASIIVNFTAKDGRTPKIDHNTREKKIKARVSFSEKFSAGCRETVTNGYSGFLRNVFNYTSLSKIKQVYDVTLRLTASLTYTDMRILYIRSLFEQGKPLKAGLDPRYYPGYSEVSKDERHIQVVTHNLIDPWKASAVLYVLKYGSSAFVEVSKTRKRKSSVAAEEYIEQLLSHNGYGRNTTSMMTIFGVYLITKGVRSGLTDIYETKIDGSDGTFGYFMYNMYPYIPEFIIFCRKYKKSLNKLGLFDRKISRSTDALLELIKRSK